MVHEIKTVRLSSKRQISIPKAFKMLNEGDQVLMEIENDKIIIRPIPKNYNLDEITRANLEVLRENWDSEEDEKAYAHLQKYRKK